MDEVHYVDVIQTCPKCQSSNANKKDLRFKVNVCGHSICEGCVALMLQRNDETCVTCKEKLLSSKFRPRKFDNDEVESYMSHYNDVKRIYNCDRVDFDSLDEYNDYLEEVELLIMDLMNKSKCEMAKLKLNEYSNIHKADIKARRNRKNVDFEEYDEFFKNNEEKKVISEKFMQQEKEKRVNMDKEYTDRLVNGTESVQELQREYASKIKKEPQSTITDGSASKVFLQAVYQYERPSYMREDSFSYKQNLHDDLKMQVMVSTFADRRSLRPGGGYTPSICFYRLHNFVE